MLNLDELMNEAALNERELSVLFYDYLGLELSEKVIKSWRKNTILPEYAAAFLSGYFRKPIDLDDFQ
jgi:hypothetical protein